ncbi:conjugal transfer protein [Burkholderia pseudomallei]|nr:conjugal transfer protein [Burkholderia pseudomallei]
MIESGNGKKSNLHVITEPSNKAANTTGTIMEDALNEHAAISSGNVLADLADTPEPTFLDDEGPNLEVPLFITKTNARELFDLRPGETVPQAAARKAVEG